MRCDLCRGVVGDGPTHNGDHRACVEEYERRANDGLCVYCGKSVHDGIAHDDCRNGDRYFDYPGGN